MATIVLNAFGGMMPRYGNQLLPNDAASVAKNALLLSGELRGLHGKTQVADLRATPHDINRVFRIPTDSGDVWVPFEDASVDMVKGPLVNDAYTRYYWTSDTDAPRMNTETRIANNDDPWLLGVPAPSNPTVVTPQTGGTIVTRAYTYTFVSAYGEEGQPAVAAVVSGNEIGTWTISGMDVVAPYPAAEHNITKKRIYRTVTSNNGIADYHFIAEIDLNVGTYVDIASTSDISLNATLESEDWATPPASLRGIIAHPNGFLVGFTGRDIYFSEPYRPHAWPAQYALSTQDPIVGLGIFGTTIVIATRGFPYTATGIRPDGMSFTKAETPEPCISPRRGIVSTPFGVYYPSDNGLMLVSSGGFINATKALLTKDEWQLNYFPYQLTAARWQSQYVAFYAPTSGFMFAPDEGKAAFVELGHDVWNHTALQEDTLSGDVLLVHDKVVYLWNPPFGVPQVYTWRSKEFVTPKPTNFGAFKFEYTGEFAIDMRLIAELIADNALRFPYPLNPLNFAALNSVRKVSTLSTFTPPGPVSEHSQPMHKSPLFVDSTVPYQGVLIFRLYADGVLVYTGTIKNQKMYRLPAGFKATRWYVEIEGNVDIRSLKIAETGKELATV